ncbi:MAG: flagellar assembly protein FliW [Nitrospirae bacterium]|nr:MAG: flagellar assembly protein FliW [Nitrospirota bacterium]
MKVTTSRFGEIEFRDEAMLIFTSGIIGFPSATRYVILDHDREVPFKWLQSVDDGSLAFVIMDPALFKPDYRVVLEPDERAELRMAEGDDLTVCVILTVPSSDPRSITANLQGPVVVNRRTRLAKQIILRDVLTTRYPLFRDDPPSLPSNEPLPLEVCQT